MAVVSASISKVLTSPASGILTAGSNAVFTITIINTSGTAPAPVVATDVITTPFTFVSITPTNVPATTFVITQPAVGGQGTITLTGTLPIGATAVFTLTVNVPVGTAPGTYTNTATLVATGGTVTGSPSSASVTVVAAPAASADLAVVITGPATAGCDQPLVYNIVATNLGPSDASTVVVTYSVPFGARVLSFVQVSGPPFILTPVSTNNSFFVPLSSLTATIATFTAGASATFQVTLVFACKVKDPCKCKKSRNVFNNGFNNAFNNAFNNGFNRNGSPVFTSTATISSVTPDPNLANNTSSVTTFVIKNKCCEKKKCKKKSKSHK